MDFLIFQLQGPLASWGGAAVGEYRGSDDYPSQSALIGLLAAALGILRSDEAQLLALQDGYRFGIGLQSAGQLLRDYHTAQVPPQAALKGWPRYSRRDELAIPKHQLETILSTRDYRQDASVLVAVQALAAAPWRLDELAQALAKPRFVLYLGRKACPPGVPLFAQVLSADTLLAAFEQYRAVLHQRQQADPAGGGSAALTRLIWSEPITPGCANSLTVKRKDRLIARQGWQFGDREEHVALLQNGAS